MSHGYGDDVASSITMEFEQDSLDEVVEYFKDFLRGCGYNTDRFEEDAYESEEVDSE
jgi:hypothetical protein